MAKIPLISTGLASALVGGTTYYSVVAAAGINFETTEANAQLTYRTAGVFSGLFIHVLTNATLNASTLRIRINGANGNQSVSIPAATTGSFEDTTNSDTIASGDKVNYSIAVGSGLGNITAIREISTFFAATTDTVCRYAVVNIPALTAGTGNYWYPLSDVPPDANGTEARSVLQVNAAATFQDFFAYVSANGVTAATVLRFRLNGANATMTVSYGSGVTGILEDTTHTDATVANDNMGFRINLGGTGTTITIKILAVSGVSTDRSFHFIMGNTNGESGSTNVLYFSPSGRGSSSTTEANKQVKMRIAALISNVFVVVSANTANGTSTFKVRKNGVDTAISASIPATTTGSFEGTSQEAFLPTDLVSYALTRGGTGTVTIRSASSLVIAMTEASDTRAAEVTGKDTANSARAAEVTGKDTSNSTRAAEVSGKDTASDTRAAEVTGTSGTDISRVSSGSGSGTSISLGSHQAGDVIFFWAYRNDSATPPSLPAGWTSITSVGASVHSGIMGYKVCASGSETSGTWTNATSVAYAIYRNVDNTTPYSHPSGQSGTGTSVSWSGIAPSIDNPGRDWVFTTFGATSDVGNMDTHAPTACTLITDYSAAGTEENTIYDTNTPVSSYSFNSKTADASITWLTKTVAIRAVPTGTSANSSRAAEVTGKDTANSTRAAEVTGKDTSNSARAAETTGKDTSNSARAAEATGKDTSSSIRAAETTGKDSANSSRAAEVTGIDGSNSSRSAEVTGKDTSNSTRAAEVTGKDTASSIRAAETSGVDTTFSIRAAETTGKDTSNSARAAEVTGIGGSQSERVAEVTGKDTTNSSRAAEVSGKENHPLAKMTTLLMALDTNGRTAAAAVYMALYSSGTTTTSLTKQTTSLMPVSGKVKRLLVRCEAGPGIGLTRSFTIQKNGVDTGIVVTLTGAGTGNGVSFGEVSGSIDFAAGESLNLKNEASGTTTDSGSTKIAVEVECAEYTSMLLTGTVSNLTNAVDNWMPIQGRGSSTVSAVNCTSIFPTSGVIQNARAALSGPPGSAKTYTFTLYKNGVATAITFTISGSSATEGSDLTHSVSVVAGDKLYWHVAVDSGATNRTCALGAEFRPTINGESVHTYATSISTTDTAVRYQSLAANNDASYQSSPVNRIFISTAATFKKFYLEQDTAPGASENYLYQLEVSASAGNPSITVSTGQTSGNDTVNEKTVADFDSVVVKITPTNTPGATVLRYSMVSFIGGTDHIRRAEVTGKDTANASRAAEVIGKDTSNSARASEVTGKSGAYLRSSSSNNAASGTALTITKPSGVQSGDVLIFIANVNGNPTTLVDNNGGTPFTLKETKPYNGAGGGATMHIFYRVAGASEPSSYAFTIGSSQRWQATMLACGQVDVNNIFGSYAGIAEVSGSGLTFSAAAIAVNKDELAIAVSGLDTATQIYDTYPTDGYVLNQAPVANQALAVSTKNISATGTQSAVSWHITSGSSLVIAYQFTLNPDSQSTRAAETTGKDVSNSARAAEVTGKDTSSTNRSAETTGKDSSNSVRSAEVTGEDHYALYFDGVNDYVDLNATDTIPNGTGQCSIVARIFHVDTGAVQSIIGNLRDGTTKGWQFKMSSNGRLEFQFYTPGGTKRAWGDIPGMEVPQNEYLNVGVTFDGNTAKFYIGATEFIRETLGTSVTIAENTADNVRIGHRQAAGSGFEFFKGGIGWARVYNRVLSAAEFTNLANIVEVSGSNLLSHWPIIEGSGLTIADTGSNDDDGTIFGAIWVDERNIQNQRAAEVTGKDTSNAVRAAEVSGRDSSQSSRSAEVSGRDFSNSERSAELIGADGLNHGGKTVVLSSGNFIAQLKSGNKNVKLESGNMRIKL